MARSYSSLTPRQQSIYRRVRRTSLTDLELQSARDLTAAQREIIMEFTLQISKEGRGAERDLSWNGPRARWLQMVGRRPVRDHVEIGDYKRRGRRR